MPFILPAPVAAGLRDSILGSFGAFVMVLIGVAGLIVGVFAVVQTTRWPSGPRATKKVKAAKQPVAAAVPPPTERAPAPARATTTTNLVRLHLPGIEPRHPDVWGDKVPLDVVVRVDPQAAGSADVRLHRSWAGERREVGRAAPDGDGRAMFAVRFDRLGECDLVAELFVGGAPSGQAVRSVRVVDYRAEVVETFEDFVAWAASNFSFAESRLTAREFVDRFADARSGTPIAPLETIADLYEVANYSEHPVDRSTYLRLVDAFLELEDAGALEGPGAQ